MTQFYDEQNLQIGSDDPKILPVASDQPAGHVHVCKLGRMKVKHTHGHENTCLVRIWRFRFCTQAAHTRQTCIICTCTLHTNYDSLQYLLTLVGWMVDSWKVDSWRPSGVEVGTLTHCKGGGVTDVIVEVKSTDASFCPRPTQKDARLCVCVYVGVCVCVGVRVWVYVCVCVCVYIQWTVTVQTNILCRVLKEGGPKSQLTSILSLQSIRRLINLTNWGGGSKWVWSLSFPLYMVVLWLTTSSDFCKFWQVFARQKTTTCGFPIVKVVRRSSTDGGPEWGTCLCVCVCACVCVCVWGGGCGVCVCVRAVGVGRVWCVRVCGACVCVCVCVCGCGACVVCACVGVGVGHALCGPTQ